MKNLKKICALFLAVLMLASVAAVSASALDGKLNVKVSSNTGSEVASTVDFSLGTEFTVELSLLTKNAVINSQGILSYDSSVVSLENLEYKNVGGSTIVNTELKDKAAFNHTEYDAKPAFNPESTLIEATFKALAAGDTEIKFNIDELNSVNASGSDTALVTDGKTASDDFSIACVIGVPADPSPILIDTKLSLKAGKTKTLDFSGDTSGVTFTSSKKSVATVSKAGVVTALKKGTATITAKYNGVPQKCKVTVTSSPSIKVNNKKFKKSTTYAVKKGKTLTVKITGKAAKVNNSYKTSNKKVAKVTSKATASSVKIKGLKKGTAKITIKVNKGTSFVVKVKVK